MLTQTQYSSSDAKSNKLNIFISKEKLFQLNLLKHFSFGFLYSYKDLPGNAIKSAYEGPLKDFLIYSKPKSVKKLFYQILPMNINELENKKQFKCFWVSHLL